MDRKPLCACLIAALLAAACSHSPSVAVGSKNFTEQVLLGEIAAQQIERRLHLRVQRQLNLGGTLLAFQALTAGQIDLYPEYSGTAFMSILHHPASSNSAEVLDQVRSEFAASLQLKWLDPLGFNNTFAMVVTTATAQARRVSSLSGAMASPGAWTIGAGYEFLERPDGFRALLAAYPKLTLSGAPKTMDLGLLYPALDQRKIDLAAANSTDASLSSPRFQVLTDDLHAFPPYQASYVVRYDTLARIPGLDRALAELSGKISDAAMRSLNTEIDIKHRPVRDVAANFLKTIP